MAEWGGTGRIDEGEALLEEGVFDLAGFGCLGDQRTGCAGGVFGGGVFVPAGLDLCGSDTDGVGTIGL